MKQIALLDGRVVLTQGNCLRAMRAMPENSVDSVVCDPPYHLHSIVKRFAKTGRTESTASKSGPHQRTARGFMGKKWDGGDIAFRIKTWEEVLRVLKPGGYLLAFSSTRTFGRMSVAIEEAGFIAHPFIAWIFGSGFPKAHRVHAEGWEGWRYGGQALKPAIEPIYMGQKPFSEENGTANVLEHGVGAINIDGCRVVSEGGGPREGETSQDSRYDDRGATNFAMKPGPRGGGALGRWPANVIHDGSEEVVSAFPAEAGAFAPVKGTEPSNAVTNVYGARERTAALFHGDSGSAARFFYTAKADEADRAGSKHPTVKPLDLMQYLVRLVTPPRGLILDPFAGTGTTGEAAWREGFRALLIEREPEYVMDIVRRMEWAVMGPEERRYAKAKLTGAADDPGPLFA